ncbi:unnamed protein product [Mytilus coruscus]|uniref:Exonuclease domain-containing protein n=1 Tax=Mytilus coruscus TaxID=42192 RepID=A0A6J7ZR71_MYTCO|nr:unnamed protein product [Mytilus coruscus]
MIDALGSPQRVNNVLSILNLPPISHKNLKVMERRAGEMIEGFANLSMDQRCREAFEAEKRNESVPAVNFSGMTVCADHGWQKRGFDSLTDIQKTWTFSWKFHKQKFRRLKLKEERITSKGACEATEGANYESEISFSEQAEDIERIPDAIPKPLYTAVPSLNNPTFVIIDLETTDLIRRNIIPHIVQIAAKEHRTQTSFNRYIPPQLPMSNEAEKVTGIVWDGQKLFYKGAELNFVNIKVAISEFFMWLSQFSNAVLVAHNGENFDFRVLSTAVYNCSMYDNFTQIVMGFVDSLAVFRSGFPKIEKYNQPFLAQHFCKEEYNAHNAVDDVNMLDKILIAANAKAKNLPSFHSLIASGVMKMTTAENIAGSGLNCAHLKLIYVRKGDDGLIDVLMSKNACGKPRDSNDKKLMCSVVQKMGKMFSEL